MTVDMTANTAMVCTEDGDLDRRMYKRVPSTDGNKAILKHLISGEKKELQIINLCAAGVLLQTNDLLLTRGEKFELTLIVRNKDTNLVKIYSYDSIVIHQAVLGTTGFLNVRRRPPE